MSDRSHPMQLLRQAAERRTAAGLACLRLTGRADLQESDFAVAQRALAVVRGHDGS